MQVGDTVTINVQSPGQTFLGAPLILFLTIFDYTGGAAVLPFNLSALPGCPCPGAYIAPQTIVVPAGVVGASGTSVSFVWPPLGKLDLLAQGITGSAAVANGYFASTNGHIFEDQ